MKPAPFQYHDPHSLDEALGLFAQHEDARALAGGQSLMPMMNFRFVQPQHLVDLNGVSELEGLSLSAETASFGAMTRQRSIERSAEAARRMPIFQLALAQVGHRQTRARGTIGGSLCHFDPSAELCNLAALHDAQLHIASKDRRRQLEFASFGAGYLSTAIEPGEVLTRIDMRVWPKAHGYAFEEFAMRHGDFAVCAVSCLAALNDAGAISDIAIAISGVEPAPVRLREVERQLIGQKPGPAAFRLAAEKAGALDAMFDAYISAAYRKHLARILTWRALQKALLPAAMETAA